MCKHAAKKLQFFKTFFTGRYKTQQMCEKFVLENGGMLIFIPDCYKDQRICNKPVDNYAHALGSVPNWYKTQKNVRKSCQYLSFYNTICPWSIWDSRNMCLSCRYLSCWYHLYLILFQIDRCLSNCVIKFFMKIPYVKILPW